MMIRAAAVDAVVPFSTMSGPGIDSTPYRLSLYGSTDERASALVRLERWPTSETDVVVATGEIVTTVGLVFSRWELRQRHDDALVAEADMSPVTVRPFTPFRVVVRLFGSGATSRRVLREA
jgi:hypothetical protein